MQREDMGTLALLNAATEALLAYLNSPPAILVKR